MIPENRQLRKFIVQAFDDEELDTFCFDHFPELEQRFSAGMTKTRKAVDLIKFCQTRGRIAELLSALERERPSLWLQVFGNVGMEVLGQAPLSSPLLEEPEQLDRYVHPRTGIILIRIPAGSFLFGSTDEDKLAYSDEKPQREIELPEFWIGHYPVTNAHFSRFVELLSYQTVAEEKGEAAVWTGEKMERIKGADWRHPHGPDSNIRGKEQHPVAQVTWHDAVAFCEWAGLQLPSEQQWEKAARGDQEGRIWPWGDETPTDEHCNFSQNVGETTPVGRYSPQGDSYYGCQDMAGNIWEWTSSENAGDKRQRVLRGGSWRNNLRGVRVAARGYFNPDYCSSDLGFRVAAPVVSDS